MNKIKTTALYVALFVLLILPSVAATYTSYNKLSQDLTEQTYNRRQTLAQLMVLAVEARLDTAKDISQLAAADMRDAVLRKQWAQTESTMQHVSESFPFADRVFIADNKGVIHAFYPPSPENVGKDFSYRDWYKGAMSTGQPYVSEVFKRAPVPQFNTVAVSVPIRDDNNNIAGVLGLAMSLDSFYELTKNFDGGQSGFMYIVNQKGQIVAHPEYSSLGSIIDYSEVAAVQSVLKKESKIGVFFNSVEQEERLSAIEMVPQYNWGVIVAEPVDTAFALRDATLRATLLFDAVIVLANVVLALIVLYILSRLRKSKDIVQAAKLQDEAILHGIGDAVFAIDTKKRITLYNPVAAGLSGYTESEALGKPYTEILNFLHEDSGMRSDAFIKTALSGQKASMSNHTIIVHRDGTKISVADSAAPIFDANKNVVGAVVVFRDVTHEREVDKAKTEFVSLASHQLRTPLTSIGWYSEMLLEGDSGKLKPEQQEHVQVIADSNKRMVDLVNSLLNVSRIDLGTFAIDPKPTKLQDVSESVLSELVPQIAVRKTVIKKSYDTSVKEINVDPQLIRIVFQNLLSNAVKYTPEKGTVSVSISKKPRSVQIVVSDTGFGIPKKDQAKIFSKLFRAENAVEKEPDGNGLGLYIVKAIIEQSKGKISFVSTEGKGTTFTVDLPLSGMTKKQGSKALS